MTDPIRLIHTAFALLDGPGRPEIGDTLTIALRGAVAMEIEATVASLEITDEEGEIAVLVDDTGCRWALPVPSTADRAA